MGHDRGSCEQDGTLGTTAGAHVAVDAMSAVLQIRYKELVKTPIVA